MDRYDEQSLQTNNDDFLNRWLSFRSAGFEGVSRIHASFSREGNNWAKFRGNLPTIDFFAYKITHILARPIVFVKNKLYRVTYICYVRN